jgi:transketolase
VEHVASLRLIPNMTVWRPCDTVETAVAWGDAVTRTTGPTSLVLSRQALAPMARTAGQVAAIARGGYVLADAQGKPAAVLIATGSEVALAVEAAKALGDKGCRVRVVSMPCTSVFDAQPQAYRESVLPPGVPCVAIEAGVRDTWWRYVTGKGVVIGMDTFGASAPAKQLFEHFGFTTANVIRTVEGLL